MEYKKILGRAFFSAVISLGVLPVQGNGAPSFQGPDSVPRYHPLCLSVLKDWDRDGGALDMQQCAYKQGEIPVTKTASGAYYAKRAEENGGYMAYKPIGTLDDAIELLLVYNKKNANPLTSIYFLGRIPGEQLGRDFLTTLEDGGDRCQGGVNDARLISASELEVDINATVRTMLTFLADDAEQDTASLSLKADSYQAFACAGVITKTYNLIDNKMHYSRVTFTRDESRKEIEQSSRCYDQVVANSIEEPRVLDMEQYQQFLDSYQQQCGDIK